MSELAAKAGWSRSYTYAVEQGVRSPTLDYLLAIVEIFDLELKLWPELALARPKEKEAAKCAE